MIDERATTLRTSDGVTLEASVAEPPPGLGGIVVAHPHPLYGGDMDNPVVVRAAEVCAGLGLATLRFNFRGVGRSTGTHGKGLAERIDVETALARLRAGAADRGVALVGYSFGAAVAAQVATRQPELAGLCLVAPPLTLGRALPPALVEVNGPFWIIAGTRDAHCPPAALSDLQREYPRARVIQVDGADHFFLGKLFPMGEHIAAWARAAFSI
jgi:alpha/beta superfamily hydrolase